MNRSEDYSLYGLDHLRNTPPQATTLEDILPELQKADPQLFNSLQAKRTLLLTVEEALRQEEIINNQQLEAALDKIAPSPFGQFIRVIVTIIIVKLGEVSLSQFEVGQELIDLDNYYSLLTFILILLIWNACDTVQKRKRMAKLLEKRKVQSQKIEPVQSLQDAIRIDAYRALSDLQKRQLHLKDADHRVAQKSSLV